MAKANKELQKEVKQSAEEKKKVSSKAKEAPKAPAKEKVEDKAKAKVVHRYIDATNASIYFKVAETLKDFKAKKEFGWFAVITDKLGTQITFERKATTQEKSIVKANRDAAVQSGVDIKKVRIYLYTRGKNIHIGIAKGHGSNNL